MANCCTFTMQVKGKKNDIIRFYYALTQKGDLWIGRGAAASIYYDSSASQGDDHCVVEIDGECKWSIESALIDDALSMQEQKRTGTGCWRLSDPNVNYVTLPEACEKFHVNMEAFSEELGCEFQEHMSYENGEFFSEIVDYCEEYDEENDEYTQEGGFPEWGSFHLMDVLNFS